MASVSGIDSATMRPGRTPRLMKLIARMIAIACHSEVMNSPMAWSTVTGWSATRTGWMPIGRLAVISSIASWMFLPSARMSPPSRMAMASPIAGLPSTRNMGWGGSAKPRRTLAMSASLIMRPPATKVVSRMSCSDSNEPETRMRDRLVPGLDDAGRPDHVLGLQGGQQGAPVDAEARQLPHRELDEDHLVLGTQDLDLRDVGHLEQLRARVLDIVAQLALGEPVGGEAVDDAECVAEPVVEERPDHAGGQRWAGCR